MREMRPGGRVVVVAVLILSVLAIGLAINISSRSVTTESGVECGTPKDPVYSWLPNLDPPDTPKGPEVDRKRAICNKALIDNGFWPVVLLLGAFVGSFLVLMLLLLARRGDARDGDGDGSGDARPRAKHAVGT